MGIFAKIDNAADERDPRRPARVALGDSFKTDALARIAMALEQIARDLNQMNEREATRDRERELNRAHKVKTSCYGSHILARIPHPDNHDCEHFSRTGENRDEHDCR